MLFWIFSTQSFWILTRNFLINFLMRSSSWFFGQIMFPNNLKMVENISQLKCDSLWDQLIIWLNWHNWKRFYVDLFMIILWLFSGFIKITFHQLNFDKLGLSFMFQRHKKGMKHCNWVFDELEKFRELCLSSLHYVRWEPEFQWKWRENEMQKKVIRRKYRNVNWF